MTDQQAKMETSMKEEELTRELIPLERTYPRTNSSGCQILTQSELLCSEILAVSFAVKTFTKNLIHLRLRTIFSVRLPNEKALKAFDMLIRILQSKGILNGCVTLVGKSDVVHRGDDSPGTKLVEYWSQNSPYWHQNCTIN